MPLTKPYFSIPDSIPIIGGDWGPWVSNHLTKGQKQKVFILFIVTLVLIFAFGAWAYYDEKKKQENPEPPAPTETPKDYQTEGFSLDDFFNVSKLVDFKSLFVGMFAGLVFGFIDNGGLWIGMDSLEPVFDSNSVPWVYGYGGRRQYDGLKDNGDSVYKNVEFKDGKLSKGELGKITNLSRKLEKDYKNQLKRIEKLPNLTNKERRKMRDNYTVNEAAYANPNSELFMGDNMTKNQFFNKFKNRRIDENLYNSYVDTYTDYLNNKDLPTTSREARNRMTLSKGEKSAKLRAKQELRLLKGGPLGLPFRNKKDKKRIKELENKIKQKRVWPGSNKTLAQAWASGWRPGSLTNSGIGNTYSDLLGSFLSTFAAVLITNAFGISDVSIISEAIGVFIGCILAIVMFRTIFSPLTYKT